MIRRARILLVSSPGGFSVTLASPLAAAGYEPVLASDFASAKAVLSERPDLLIADVKLGAYNGLHLAIRAASIGTPAIIVGDPDRVLEAEAEQQHAMYLTTPLDAERSLSVVSRVLEASRQTRRSARKQVPWLDALVDDIQARLVDVSYDGMRIETAAPQHTALPLYFVVRLPQFNFACRVQRVWMAPVMGSNAGGAVVWCGATVAASDREASSAWRNLVDRIPPLSTTP